jgi:hypothetical protein
VRHPETAREQTHRVIRNTVCVRLLMERHFRISTACCVSIIAALLVVGAVSHGVIRHIVQTSPLWIAIVSGVRRSAWSKWAALPCFVFWFLVMSAIWMFLLGWARFVSGTFSSTEIAMTVVVGLASLAGMVTAVGIRSGVSLWSATGIILLVAILQLTAFRSSFLPAIAHR